MNSKGFRGKRKNEFSFYEFMTQEFERDLKGLERNIQRGLKGILLRIGALQTQIKLTLN